MQASVCIRPVETEHDLDIFRTLVREYAAFISFDLSFQHFDDELAALPGKYAPKSGGAMLLGFVQSEPTQNEPTQNELPMMPAGCVAMRDLGEGICEMKRLFVRPEAQGLAIGKLLSQELMRLAKDMGYRAMRLDTRREAMPHAFGLYTSLGFYEIPAYNENPYSDICYMECRL